MVNLKTVGPSFRFEIVHKGTLIYKENDEVENNFELRVYRNIKIPII